MANSHLQESRWITVQHLLGHSKITMTARYAHALADAKIEAVKKLEKVSTINETGRQVARNYDGFR